MQAMGGTKKAKFWENDDSGRADGAAAEGKAAGEEKERLWKMMEGKEGAEDEGEASDDEYDNAPVIGGEEEKEQAEDGEQQDGDRLAKANLSDADYLKARQNKAFDSDEEAEGEAERVEEQAEAGGEEAMDELDEQKEGAAAATEPVELDDTRLFVRNLPFSITEDDLHAHFAPHGPIQSIHIPTHGADGSGKGFAFVTYHNASHAARALAALNNRIVMGRLVHILPSQKRPATAEAAAAEQGKELTYKAQKARALKAAAGDATHSNTLFLRADTVMASMAARLQVDKADILNADDSSSLAVRLALAESHLINETKGWLKQQGVNVSSLERTGEADADAKLRAAIRRSDRVILCKNIPFETEAAELRAMFGKFGALVRVVLPPSKTLALLEYETAAQAKAGYAALAYTKYHHVPLYLEWAPVDTFATATPPAAAASAAAAVVPKSAAALAADSAPADGDAEGNTVFVKNLSFATTEQSLLDLFKAAAAVRSVHIATKKNSSRAVAGGAPKTLSMGYGFVELRAGEDVRALIGRMQGVQLDGHALELKPSTCSLSNTAAAATSNAAAGASSAGVADGTSRRLIVKNLPFEATTAEVRALFASFASVTRVRLPKKMDGSHRGYGFVDFSSGEEAREAIARLAHTHLYGRSLVLQFSDEREEGEGEGEGAEAGEERLKRQREKVRRQYEQSQSDMPAHKRSKKVAVDDEV